MKLSVQNGCFSYRAGQPLLENISFEVESGDVLAILGPNGAGKPTLLKCMLNLLHWRQEIKRNIRAGGGRGRRF